jgi:hypothetical protein
MNEASFVSVHGTLMLRAEGLVREFDELPAGSVLRTFARAVGEVRRSGCELAQLPDLAEGHARAILTLRADAGHAPA